MIQLLRPATLALLVAGAGCTKRVTVEVPPRIDLARYGTIGLVEFDADGDDQMAQMTTQRFLEAVQAAQPGTPVLELGSKSKVLSSVNRKQWDSETIRQVGRDHGVDALVVGDIELRKIKPTISVSTFIKDLSARFEVEAELSARLIETGSGATVWTDSAGARETVARAGFSRKGSGHIDVSDPEAAFGGMMDGLVYLVTEDFRAHYEKVRVAR